MNDAKLPQSDPTEPAASDEELFRRAVEALETVPDKDSPTGAPKIRRAQRIKTPRSMTSPPDEVLDLHTKTLQEARAALTYFLQRARHSGHRTVLVITGKGLGSTTPGGVLRGEMERWLRYEGSDFVRAYSEAPRALGGRGAYLLHLRKGR